MSKIELDSTEETIVTERIGIIQCIDYGHRRDVQSEETVDRHAENVEWTRISPKGRLTEDGDVHD